MGYCSGEACDDPQKQGARLGTDNEKLPHRVSSQETMREERHSGFAHLLIKVNQHKMIVKGREKNE